VHPRKSEEYPHEVFQSTDLSPHHRCGRQHSVFRASSASLFTKRKRIVSTSTLSAFSPAFRASLASLVIGPKEQAVRNFISGPYHRRRPYTGFSSWREYPPATERAGFRGVRKRPVRVARTPIDATERVSSRFLRTDRSGSWTRIMLGLFNRTSSPHSLRTGSRGERSRKRSQT